MKPSVTSKPLFSAEQMTAAWAAAPDHVDDPDCSYNPNDPAAVETYWKNAIVSHSLPDLRTKLAAQRGRQKRPVKESVTVRYSPDVLAYFRATGAGWQTRMNDVLREWVKSSHSVLSVDTTSVCNRIGVAKGKFKASDSIDTRNKEVAHVFLS